MCTGIEVQSICYVGIGQGQLGSDVNVLAPRRRPAGDQILAVLADDDEHRLVVRPNDILPRLVNWLVPRLENQVGVATVYP